MKSVINQYTDSPPPGVLVALFLKVLCPNDVFIFKKLNTVERMTKPPPTPIWKALWLKIPHSNAGTISEILPSMLD